MKFPLLSAALVALALPSLSAAELSGDEILRQMSERLAAAPAFRFEATREVDSSLLPGFALSGKVRIAALVQRPGKFAAFSESKSDSRQFIANGRTLTVFDARKNFYATIPTPPTIDGLIDKLDEKYGFTPPLADFAVSNPFQEFKRQAKMIESLGRAKVGTGFLGLGGVETNHIALKGRVADAELWIGVKDHLPRKLVATFHRPGRPQVRVDFLAWDLAPHVSPADFSFTPPKGALKIEMVTTEKLQTLSKQKKKSMRTPIKFLTPSLVAAALLAIAAVSHARDYGISSRSVGRGTYYTDNRGGSAYVGPRGFAAQGADGRTVAAADRGAAYAGPNGAAYARGYGTTYTGGAVVTGTTVAAPLPVGYITAVPVGAPTFVVSGYNCYFLNGIYYRPVFYGGTTVYVPVT